MQSKVDVLQLPTEVRLAERCVAAIDRGDVALARKHAETGLRLAKAKGVRKWIERFHHLLQICSPQPSPDASSEPITCSFCQEPHCTARPVVAGPRVFICRQCVDRCIGRTFEPTGIRPDPAYERCSFCNRDMDRGPLYGARGWYICAECLLVCQDIFADRR
jgi:hypothetical protein